jgi:hypothetical protein
MSPKQESLRELIESSAAFHGVARRTLCGWALDAIARNELPLILPEGMSLDTESSHGGMPLTWRRVVEGALNRIEDIDPSGFSWFRRLKCEPTLFDRWLKTKLQAISLPRGSRFPVQKRPTDAEVRRVVGDYVGRERTAGRIPAIPRMWEYLKKQLPNATRDQGKTALRHIEGGPKRRGRPRKSRSASQKISKNVSR